MIGYTGNPYKKDGDASLPIYIENYVRPTHILVCTRVRFDKIVVACGSYEEMCDLKHKLDSQLGFDYKKYEGCDYDLLQMFYIHETNGVCEVVKIGWDKALKFCLDKEDFNESHL